MYSGAVRAGKTYALCLRAAMRAAKPHAREILCRKTLAALKATTLVTLLDGDGFNPPVLPKGTYTHNRADKVIRINGGGEIVYFALVNDGAEGVQQRAGSYSGTGVNIDEATELDEADYRMLLSRASIAHPDVPLQVAMACNPGSPSHFLAKRFAPPGSGYSEPIKGCECIGTKTTDNFFLPPEYIEGLERDAGSLWYRRFVQGLWVGAEGLVYDQWDRELHRQTRRITDFREFVIGVDQGFTHPFAALLAGIDGDGRIHIIAEEYRSGWKAQDKVAAVVRLTAKASGSPNASVSAVVVDSAAPELIAELRDAGHRACGVDKKVLEGIHLVEKRLQVAGDGRVRLSVDPSCENLIREMETYSWKKDKPKDEPEKKHDDLCLIAGTVIATDAGQIPIEHIQSGAMVWTRTGLRRVVAAYQTSESTETLRVVFSDGRSIAGTPNHPIWVDGRGFVPIDAMRYGDIISTLWENTKAFGCEPLESGTTDTRSLRDGPTGHTGRRASLTVKPGLTTTTENSGNESAGRFRRALWSITRTATRSTTRLKTLSAWREASIRRTTEKPCLQRGGPRLLSGLFGWLFRPPVLGTHPKLVSGGTLSTERRHGSAVRSGIALASGAEKCSRPTAHNAQDFVTSTAKPPLAEHRALTTSAASVPTAEVCSRQTGTTRPVFVVDIVPNGRAAVWNLTVEGKPEYYANGVLCHNCDSLRYLTVHIDGGLEFAIASTGTRDTYHPITSSGREGTLDPWADDDRLWHRL